MTSPHSVIFLGTPDFAVPSLEALAKDPRFSVTLVVTQPDRPVGRKQVLTAPPVKEAAERHGIPVFQPENINAELPRYLEEHAIAPPDFLVTVAYGKILSRDILTLPVVAPVNVHASLLPRWRGASPIEHAILAGDTETGVTIQIMAPELDAGDILSASALPIGPRDTAVELREHLATMGATLLRETLARPLHPLPQPEEGITFCGKLTKEDGRMNPHEKTAEEIDRAIRAFTPWPGVTMMINETPLKILHASREVQPHALPLLCKNDTTLYLLTVQPPGKKSMSAEAWQRGNHS